MKIDQKIENYRKKINLLNSIRHCMGPDFDLSDRSSVDEFLSALGERGAVVMIPDTMDAQSVSSVRIVDPEKRRHNPRPRESSINERPYGESEEGYGNHLDSKIRQDGSTNRTFPNKDEVRNAESPPPRRHSLVPVQPESGGVEMPSVSNQKPLSDNY